QAAFPVPPAASPATASQRDSRAVHAENATVILNSLPAKPGTRKPANPSASEQSSIPVDQDLLCGLLGSGGVVGPFDEFAVLELRAGADERHEMGRVDRPPA